MLKILFSSIFFLFIFENSLFAQTFSFGKFSIGDSRIKVELSDFVIQTSNPDVSATWRPDSVQWIRNENNLLVPRALLRIVIKENVDLVHVDYKNMAVIPFKNKDQNFETDIYIDLFNPDTAFIYSGSGLLDKIIIEARAAKNARSKQLIDYSCAPYDLKIDGIDSEYLSIGCKMNRIGSPLNNHPRLEITMSSTNLRTMSEAKPPFTIYLEDNSPVIIKMKGVDQTVKIFRLTASLPDRLYRFKTSFGLGPYIYQSEFQNDKQTANFAPAFMLYAKFDLTETASIKAFDALLYSKSRFNNSGLYFSYDLAEAFDGRVLLNALLGFQGLHYKYSNKTNTEFHLIYPQGFELIYKHAFIENYHLTYGMFLSTSAQSYTNAWIRYGRGSFLELNYIDWGNDQDNTKRHIKMWGLSVGLPLFNAF